MVKICSRGHSQIVEHILRPRVLGVDLDDELHEKQVLSLRRLRRKFKIFAFKLKNNARPLIKFDAAKDAITRFQKTPQKNSVPKFRHEICKTAHSLKFFSC